MCGLIGFTSNGAKADPRILRKLMTANDSRGGHSTGYYDGGCLNKVIGKSDTLPMPKMTEIFIGHTRYATHGQTTIANQHPFQYGSVIGAHNGVVHNYREVGEKFGLEKTEVDSQMIFSVLNKENGELDTLGKFSGALATLFTMGDGKLYTYRKTNPLWVGRDMKGGVYFSSLRDVMIECKLQEIFQLKEGRVYVWEEGVVVAKHDIDSDPIASKYGAVKKKWYEYGNAYNTKINKEYNFYKQNRGANHGITDDFDFDDKPITLYSNKNVKGWDEIEDERDIIGMEDSPSETNSHVEFDKVDDIDITDYDLTENQDQLKMFDNRCSCQGNASDNICWCIS